MAQASKYKKEYPDLLIIHMASGKSFESFGALADCTFKTLYNWVDKYPDFREAKERGELKALDWWEDIGLRAMRGEIENFKPVPWIFWGKCRFRKYGYKDEAEVIAPKDRTDEAAALLLLLKETVSDRQCQNNSRTILESQSPRLQSQSGLLGASAETSSMKSCEEPQT